MIYFYQHLVMRPTLRSSFEGSKSAAAAEESSTLLAAAGAAGAALLVGLLSFIYIYNSIRDKFI